MATFLGRKFVEPYPHFRPEDISNEFQMDNLIKDIRNRVRSVLMPGATTDNLTGNTNWVVSEIVKWLNGSNRGYAFLVRQMDGEASPSATGFEILFVYGLHIINGLSLVNDILATSSANNYYSSVYRFDDVLENNSGFVHMVHFSNTSGTVVGDRYNFGFSNFAEARFAGSNFGDGDFSSAAVDPRTQLSSFIQGDSQNSPYGFCFLNDPGSSVHGAYYIFDDAIDHPNITIYHTFDSTPQVRYISLLGGIITPIDSGDIYNQASLKLQIDHTETSMGTRNNYRLVSRDKSGVRGSYAFPADYNDFSQFNSPKPNDSSYPWLNVMTSNSGYFKGGFNTNVVRVVGPSNREHYRAYSTPGGPLLKVQNILGFPYGVNEAPPMAARTFL